MSEFEPQLEVPEPVTRRIGEENVESFPFLQESLGEGRFDRNSSILPTIGPDGSFETDSDSGHEVGVIRYTANSSGNHGLRLVAPEEDSHGIDAEGEGRMTLPPKDIFLTSAPSMVKAENTESEISCVEPETTLSGEAPLTCHEQEVLITDEFQPEGIGIVQDRQIFEPDLEQDDSEHVETKHQDSSNHFQLVHNGGMNMNPFGMGTVIRTPPAQYLYLDPPLHHPSMVDHGTGNGLFFRGNSQDEMSIPMGIAYAHQVSIERLPNPRHWKSASQSEKGERFINS